MQPKPTVPMALDPLAVTKFKKLDVETMKPVPDPGLDALEQAMTIAQTKARELADICDAVEADKSITADAAAIRVRQASLKIGEAAAAKLDAAKASIEREIAAITAATSAPPPPANATALQIEAEVRAAFKGMTDAERKAEWTAAMNSDDETIISAILRGPAMLSGMHSAQLEMRRHSWRQKRFPQECDREVRLHKALSAAERAGQSLVAYVRRISAGPGAEAESVQEHAREMLKKAEAAE